MPRPNEALARRLKVAEKLPPLVSGGPRIPTGKLAREIVRFLRQNPGQAYTPNDIIQAVKAPKASVKKELCRLLLGDKSGSPPPVLRVERGLYACYLGPAELALVENPEPKVHALQLTWKASDSPLNGGFPPRSPPGVADAGFGAIRPRGSWHHDESSRSWRVVRFSGPHEITLQAFPTTGTVLASISSSENPLDAPALSRLRIWLEATFAAEGFRWTDPLVSTVEINRDYKRLRLTGADAARFYLARMGIHGEQLRFSALEGALVQVYNKHDYLRMEVRLQPRSLTLENLGGLVANWMYGPRDTGEALPERPGPEGGYA